MDSDLRQRDRNIAKRKRQLADSEKRITELDAIFKRLYEDNISGKLSDERFQKLSADYEKEGQELKVLTSPLRKEVELGKSKSADVDRFLSVVERYTDIPELTPCILHEFVEKIIVHAASDPKGKNRMQEIDIYYKGIGANVHLAVDFINRIQNHVISRSILSNSRRTPRLYIIQRILSRKYSQILL